MEKEQQKRAGKGFPLFIFNEYMGDAIEIVELLEKSRLLIAGATETVKHENKKNPRRWISWWCDGTYSCFIDSTYGFFIDTTCRMEP